MKKNIKQKGFTLLEVIIAISIFSVLMLAVNMLFVSLYRQQGVSMVTIQGTQVLNGAISIMSRELREGRSGENGDYFITVVQDNVLTFYSDVDSDGSTERISYALVGGELKKTVVQPGASTPYYSGTGVVSVVCSDVINGETPVFSYYDENYTGSGVPMVSPQTTAIKLVGVSLTVDSADLSHSAPFHAETKVQLRNTK